MFNYCATIAQLVAPRNPEKQGEVPGNQLFMGTIALPFVNYCVTIAQLLRLFPWPLLLWPQYPSYKGCARIQEEQNRAKWGQRLHFAEHTSSPDRNWKSCSSTRTFFRKNPCVCVRVSIFASLLVICWLFGRFRLRWGGPKGHVPSPNPSFVWFFGGYCFLFKEDLGWGGAWWAPPHLTLPFLVCFYSFFNSLLCFFVIGGGCLVRWGGARRAPTHLALPFFHLFFFWLSFWWVFVFQENRCFSASSEGFLLVWVGVLFQLSAGKQDINFHYVYKSIIRYWLIALTCLPQSLPFNPSFFISLLFGFLSTIHLSLQHSLKKASCLHFILNMAPVFFWFQHFCFSLSKHLPSTSF